MTTFTAEHIENAKWVLAKHIGYGNLSVDVNSICTRDNIDVESYDHYGLIVLSYEGEEYAVALDDEQAEKAASKCIADTVWVFSAEFLVNYLPDGFETKYIRMIQENACEDCNDMFYNLIAAGGELDNFVDDAISADGREQFLGHYDSEEIEVLNGFMYRIN